MQSARKRTQPYCGILTASLLGVQLQSGAQDNSYYLQVAARSAKHLEESKEDFEEAKRIKEKDPSGYLNSLVQLSIAYRGAHQPETADRILDSAIDFYQSKEGEAAKSNSLRTLWDGLRQTSADRFEAIFPSIFRTAELRSKTDPSLCDELIICMDRRRAPWNKDMRKIWKSAIDIRSSIRGEADPSLGVLLSRYGYACETVGDWTTAEESYTRAYSLNPHHDAIDLAIHKTQMARFYIRQGMFAKAEAAWRVAASETTSSGGWSVARELADLIPEYQQHLQQAQAEKLIQAMLTISGDQVITAFDPQLAKLYNAYVSSGALDKAKLLAVQRLTASSSCINDWNVNAWRLRLSDIEKRITLVPK